VEVKDVEDLLKALADKNRLRIIKLLEARTMCVCELAFVLGISQPSVSRHLRKLRSAGLVECAQDHFWTNYYLKQGSEPLETLLTCFKRHLDGNSVVKADRAKLKKADRVRLCCKG
jgi:ArsR family transcriptional regulator, arsenate/arsenite/antimonite-responsive transcriptional repressor